MKKISVILGTLAIGCVAMFTSCKQDVTVTNWDEQVRAWEINTYDYYYNVIGSIVSETKYNGYTVYVHDGCTVEWENKINTNYKTYKFNIRGMVLQRNGDILRADHISFNLLSPDHLEEPVSICFDGDTPFSFNRVNVEGNIEGSSFTITLGTLYSNSDPNSMTLTFTRW